MVSWSIFSAVRQVKKREKEKDAFDKLIEIIERFAPRDHLSEREVFYYNYRIMGEYRQPLLTLLETAARIDRYRSDPEGHSRRLFMDLKAFYDIRDRLSLEEAKRDLGLVRRFRDLLLYFYDRKNLSGEDIRLMLRDL